MGNPKGLAIARARSIRPFGFLVLDHLVDSSRCRSLPGCGFDKGNPKGQTFELFAAPNLGCTSWEVFTHER